MFSMSSIPASLGWYGWDCRIVRTISYTHEIEYGYDEQGMRLPLLKFRLSNPEKPELIVDIEASLDSGAERSLVDGQIGAALGLDVLRGPRQTFETMAGSFLIATLHKVQLSHPKLGRFELEIAFSTGEIRRNLLGRDFFDLVQIGFREHFLTFFVTPIP